MCTMQVVRPVEIMEYFLKSEQRQALIWTRSSSAPNNTILLLPRVHNPQRVQVQSMRTIGSGWAKSDLLMSYRMLWTTPVSVAPPSGIMALWSGKRRYGSWWCTHRSSLRVTVSYHVRESACVPNFRNSKNHVAQKETTKLGHSKTENNREHYHVKMHSKHQSTHKKKTGELAGRMLGGARSMTYYQKMTQRSDSARPEPIVRRDRTCTLWGLWTLATTC